MLFGTAGIYFQLNYSFLGAVQMLIYAGGITVLYVFSILLTSSEGDTLGGPARIQARRGTGWPRSPRLGVCLWITLRHKFVPSRLRARRAARAAASAMR